MKRKFNYNYSRKRISHIKDLFFFIVIKFFIPVSSMQIPNFQKHYNIFAERNKSKRLQTFTFLFKNRPGDEYLHDILPKTFYPKHCIAGTHTHTSAYLIFFWNIYRDMIKQTTIVQMRNFICLSLFDCIKRNESSNEEPAPINYTQFLLKRILITKIEFAILINIETYIKKTHKIYIFLVYLYTYNPQ